MKKTCTKCGLEQPLENYAPQKKGKFGRTSWCRSCAGVRRRARYAANPGRELAVNAAWHEKNRDRHAALCRRWRAENIDRFRELTRNWMRDARKTRPEYTMRFRIASQIGKALRGQRFAEPTFQRLGYTLQQLKEHMERQFVRGMGWHNMGEWHIDHITPISHFNISGPDDPNIRVAWALPNLRPLWSAENIKKRERRTHLL